MNIWLKFFAKVIIVVPLEKSESPYRIDIVYNHDKITFLKIHSCIESSERCASLTYGVFWYCMALYISNGLLTYR